jgi:hypothetical protein
MRLLKKLLCAVLVVLALLISGEAATAQVQPGFVGALYSGISYTPPTTSLAAHYDGSVSSSIHIATGVSQWDDLSGNARNITQATTTKQPANSGSIITFDGSNDFLQVSYTLNAPITVYLVVRADVNDANGTYWDGANNASFIYSASTIPAVYFDGLTGNISGWTASAWHVIMCVIKAGTDAVVSCDGGTSQTFGGGTVLSTTGGGFTLGCRGGGAFCSHISVEEIYVYSTAHTSTTWVDLINYLKTKWGI